MGGKPAIVGFNETHRICIDTLDADRVVGIGHTQGQAKSIQPFNASLAKMAECILIWRDFVIEIESKNGPNSYYDNQVSHAQVKGLAKKLGQADATFEGSRSPWRQLIGNYRDCIDDLKADGAYMF